MTSQGDGARGGGREVKAGGRSGRGQEEGG